MDIAQPMKFTVDINKGLLPQPQRTVLKQGDANANRVIVAMKDGDKPYDITGVMVTGAFLRPPNGDRVDLTGEANGNEASVLLTGQCYEIEGQYELDVILHYADARRTVLAIDGYVENRGSGEIVITGTVQGIDELLAQIDAMKAATADGLAAAQEARAAGGEAKATAEAAGDEAKNTANAAAEYAREQGASAANAAGTASAAAALANTGANTANLAATNANNAIAGLDEKISAGVEEGIAQITDGSADMAEVVSARTDEDGVVHTSLKTRLDDGFGLLKATKASAILDESARAASHELYAQRESPLGVTLHGYTYQEGEGDPSPDNVRPIHGLEAAQVRAGGKNLLGKPFISGTYGTDGHYTNVTVITTKGFYLCAGTYTISCAALDGIANVYARRMVDETHFSGQSFPFGLERTFLVPQSGMYCIQFNSRTNESLEALIDTVNETAMLNAGDTDANYEPYLATTADLPLLPDGSPLMEGDTVENWVRSGCDKKIVLDGDLTKYSAYPGRITPGYQLVYWSEISGLNYSAEIYCERYPSRRVYGVANTGIYAGNHQIDLQVRADELEPYGYDGTLDTAISAMSAYLSATPLTVYYRSTDYTPDKDLRVCRVVRKRKTVTFDGSNDEKWYYYNEGETLLRSFFIDIPDKIMGSYHSIADRYTNVREAYKDERYGVYGDHPSIARLYFRPQSVDVEDADSITGLNKFKTALAADPVKVVYELATPETYMTDPLPLLPPAALETATVTVTGSGETEVEYAHDTKHYIDSKISELVTLALASN